MTTRWSAPWAAAPLLAAFAVLRVAADAPGEYSLLDLLLTLVTVTAVAAVLAGTVHVGAARIARRPSTVRMVDLVFALAVAFLFLGSSLAAAFTDATGYLLRVRFIFLAVTVAIGAAWLRRASFLGATRFVTTAAVFLVVGACVHAMSWVIRSDRAPAVDRLVAQLGKGVPAGVGSAPDAAGGRDIYLLILDARANGRALRKYFGYDDGAFTDSLRALGFTIPQQVRSNYVWTSLSLPSMLNFAYVNELHTDGDDWRANAAARDLVRGNRTAVFLKARAYRYYLFPSEWHPPTASSPLADDTFRALPATHPHRVSGTAFRREVFGGTPIERLGWLGDPAAHPRRTLAGLSRVADDPRPTFVLAHVLLPHDPYVFGDACAPHRQDPRSDLELAKRLYIQQLRCTNDLVLAAITDILARSERTPIIAIVGDHGARLAVFEGASRQLDPQDALEEPYAAFGAFLTPGVPDLFAGEVSLVNVMQRILVSYFAAQVDPSPDRFFASGFRTRFRLTEVTGKLAGRSLGQPKPPGN